MTVAAAVAALPAALAGCGGSDMKASASVSGSIVFSKAANGHADIYLLASDATKRMASDGNLDAAAPAWSPNGQFVAYVTDKNQLSVMKTDPDVPAVLITSETTDGSSAPQSPAWLPNGTISYESGGKLIIVQPDGTRVRALTPANPHSKQGTLGAAYAWSPDGEHLVFDCGGDRGTTICETDLASGNTRVLFDPKVKFGTLDWSPDGTTIVAGSGAETSHMEGQAADVYLFDATGTHLRALPQPGQESTPAWSPDGRSIVYASDREPDPGLWMISADGTAAKQLLSENAASSPDWTG